MKLNIITAVLIASLATLLAQATPTPTATPKPPQVQALAGPITVGRDFTLGWTDPNPQGDVTGYKLKYGPTSGTYTTTVDVPGQAAAGAQKTKAFVAFPLGNAFFVCTAYNAAGVESAPTAETALVVASVPLPPGSISVVSGKLVQFNSRSLLGSGNRAVVASVKVDESCKIAIRALGPSLPATLKPAAGTTVALRTTNGVLIEQNTGWQNGPDKQELIDTKLAPPNAKESALITTVDPGVYNVTVAYVGSSGVGQLELYQMP